MRCDVPIWISFGLPTGPGKPTHANNGDKANSGLPETGTADSETSS